MTVFLEISGGFLYLYYCDTEQSLGNLWCTGRLKSPHLQRSDGWRCMQFWHFLGLKGFRTLTVSLKSGNRSVVVMETDTWSGAWSYVQVPLPDSDDIIQVGVSSSNVPLLRGTLKSMTKLQWNNQSRRCDEISSLWFPIFFPLYIFNLVGHHRRQDIKQRDNACSGWCHFFKRQMQDDSMARWSTSPPIRMRLYQRIHSVSRWRAL